MNILTNIFAILERLVGELVLVLKNTNFIRIQKNGYHVLIVISQLLLLVIDAHFILETIMLFNIIIDFRLRL